MAGKGSAPRKDPTGEARKNFQNNWDKIFSTRPSNGEDNKKPTTNNSK